MRPIRALRRVAENIYRVEELVAAAARLQEAADNLATNLNEKLDRAHIATDNESTLLNKKLDRLQEAADNEANLLNGKLGRLQEATDNGSCLLNEKLHRLHEATNNETTILNDGLYRLQQAADNQSAAVNRSLDKLIEVLEDQSNSLSARLKDVVLAITNQSTSTNLRLDQLIDARSSVVVPKETNSQTNEKPKSGDIELVERYSQDWQENAYSYVKSLPDLREAARRLLQVLEHPNGSYNMSDDELSRLHRVEREVACLARQPLFFTEMFHGVAQRRDGGFEPLDGSDAEHLRADGLLGVEDRRALREIYERLIANSRSPIRVAEIGSAAGRGSTPIAGEYVKRVGGRLYCIDPWLGSWYFAFLANIKIFSLESTIVPIRSPSAPAASLFDDESLDGVFVDGSHIYPDVLADIDAYLPKIRKGGWIFGHDLYDVPSRFDRHELLSIAAVNNADANYTNSNGEIERVNAHPGVILAVQDRFGDDVELFGEGCVVWAKQV